MTIHKTSRSLFRTVFDFYDAAVAKGDTVLALQRREALIKTHDDASESCERLLARVKELEKREHDHYHEHTGS